MIRIKYVGQKTTVITPQNDYHQHEQFMNFSCRCIFMRGLTELLNWSVMLMEIEVEQVTVRPQRVTRTNASLRPERPS